MSSALSLRYAIYVNVTQAPSTSRGYGLGTAQLHRDRDGGSPGCSRGCWPLCSAPIYRRTGRYTFAWALGIWAAGYLLAGLQIGLLPAVLAVCAPGGRGRPFNPCLMLEPHRRPPPEDLLPGGHPRWCSRCPERGLFSLSPTWWGAFCAPLPGRGATAQFLAGGARTLPVRWCCARQGAARSAWSGSSERTLGMPAFLAADSPVCPSTGESPLRRLLLGKERNRCRPKEDAEQASRSPIGSPAPGLPLGWEGGRPRAAEVSDRRPGFPLQSLERKKVWKRSREKTEENQDFGQRLT